MKQKILGTSLGRTAIRLRDKQEILRFAFFCPAEVGRIANDQLATRLVTLLCQPYKTFIDVGAHIGSVISQVQYENPSIKIIAIEAIPEKAKNIRLKFPKIELHNCAVSDTTGDVSFFINKEQSGYSSLIKPEKITPETVEEIKVPLRKLDDLINATDVDVIKIDVEGAELGVLRGCPDIIKRSRPIIMFESAPQKDNRFGFTKESMYEYFTEIDYLLFVPGRVPHMGPGMSKEGFVESHIYPHRTTNYFAIPKERRDEIRTRAFKLLA